MLALLLLHTLSVEHGKEALRGHVTALPAPTGKNAASPSEGRRKARGKLGEYHTHR